MDNTPASITLNISFPPQLVREYFEGMAKVESARHPPASDFSWGPIVGIAASAIAPLLSGLTNSYKPTVRVPEPRQGPKTWDQEKEECPTIKVECKVGCKEECKEECPAATSTDVKKECQAESPVLEKKELPIEKKDCPVETKKEESKIKKPSYQDGNVTIDLSNLSGNGSGIADMMKMFAPMMEGLISGIPNKPTEPPEVRPSPEGHTATVAEAYTE